MACIVEFDRTVRFNFAQNKNKQKIWIEALLHFTKGDIPQLAAILGVPIEILSSVRRGDVYFSQGSVDRLAQLFLVTFSD